MASQAKGRTAVLVWINDGDITALIDDNGHLPVQVAGQDANLDINIAASAITLNTSEQSPLSDIEAQAYGWDNDGSAWVKLQTDTNKRLLVINPDAGYVHVRDKKAQNTSGGTFTNGAWRTRDINEEVSDTEGICSVASNQITLDAGTYRCSISSPAFRVDRHQTRLYDTTGSLVLLVGSAEYCDSGDATQTRSLIKGRFTLSVQSVLEVQHRCEVTAATNGLGVAANLTDEIYTVAIFERE